MSDTETTTAVARVQGKFAPKANPSPRSQVHATLRNLCTLSRHYASAETDGLVDRTLIEFPVIAYADESLKLLERVLAEGPLVSKYEIEAHVSKLTYKVPEVSKC